MPGLKRYQHPGIFREVKSMGISLDLICQSSSVTEFNIKQKSCGSAGFLFSSLCYNQNMNTRAIGLTPQQIEAFCQKHHIRSLAFFGSAVRDDFGPHSDIDVLVAFESGHIPGFDFFLIEAELSKLMGRKVDLQTANFLGPEILKSALADAVTAYQQA